MEALIDSISRYTASLEQRLSALESALSMLQTQWAVAQTKEKEQEAVIASQVNHISSLESKISVLQACISAQEERIAILERTLEDSDWVELPEEKAADLPEETLEETPEETPEETQTPEEPIETIEHIETIEPIETTPPISEPKANLYGKPVDDIRQAIALGDRFLFQRELFRQNVELMQRTFADINALHSFDEAIAYLDKHFDWDKESNTYALFLTALHRRFS